MHIIEASDVSQRDTGTPYMSRVESVYVSRDLVIRRLSALCQPRRVLDLYTNRRPVGAFIVARSGFQGCRIGFGYLNCIGIDVGAYGFAAAS